MEAGKRHRSGLILLGGAASRASGRLDSAPRMEWEYVAQLTRSDGSVTERPYRHELQPRIGDIITVDAQTWQVTAVVHPAQNRLGRIAATRFFATGGGG